MIQLPVAVHYLLRRGKATLAALTHGIGQSVGHVAEKENKSIIRIGVHLNSQNTHFKIVLQYVVAGNAISI